MFNDIAFDSKEEIKKEGFVGFRKVRELFLKENRSVLDNKRGIYMVLYNGGALP